MATKKKAVKKEASPKIEKKEIVKKELRFRHSRDGMHQEIYYEQGGQVPDVLAGRYTTAAFASQAIARYKASK